MFGKLLGQTAPAAPEGGGEVIYTIQQVAKHNSQKDIWLVIDGKVYDVTQWKNRHPGGAAVLLQHAGRDATEAANQAHGGSEKPQETMKDFCIGRLAAEGESPTEDTESLFSDAASTKKSDTKKQIIPEQSSVSEDGRSLTNPRDSAKGSAKSSEAPPQQSVKKPSRSAAAPLPPPPMPGDRGGSSSSADKPKAQAKAEAGAPSPPTPQKDPTRQKLLEAPGQKRSPAQSGEIDSPREGGQAANVDTLEDLQMDPEWVSEAQACWQNFLEVSQSKEVAGEAIYAAVFESAPTLRELFTTPRAIQALRFMAGFQTLIDHLDKPHELRNVVEALGFSHLSIDVTWERAAVFKDGFLEMLEVEIGDRFTHEAKMGISEMMSYAAGAMIYVRKNYGERLATLERSWKKANKGKKKADAEKTQHDEADEEQKAALADPTSGEVEAEAKSNADNSKTKDGGKKAKSALNRSVPTTFVGMFEVSAAVMGISATGGWMKEVLNSFENIVMNVKNNSRLQEECNVLSLRLSKCLNRSKIELPQFRSCMLAALRSLLPKDWDSSHELAWNWLWGHVERMIKATLGQPERWEAAIIGLLGGFDSDESYNIRAEIYEKFLTENPGGQIFFKQSDQRLHFIADRIIDMTKEFFRDPINMTDSISALGLRHVGYGIPTELFPPFTDCCVRVMRNHTKDETSLEAFQWSLGLIAQMLVRTITEGSTIVMKAINSNSQKQLKKSMMAAPRGQRAKWMLQIQVGTQSISPLMWAIESGRIDSAKMIIEDLLAIRADRERYYYGVDELFTRHPEIVQRLCTQAPVLLPTLLGGMVWRSSIVEKGERRVNYYVKHMIIDREGGISRNLEYTVKAKMPKIMAHDVMVFVADCLWDRLIMRQFVISKVWFVMSLIIFMFSQALLPKMEGAREDLNIGWTIFIMRIFTYTLTTPKLFVVHGTGMLNGYRSGETFKWCCCQMPKYVKDVENFGSIVLTFFIVLMCTHEPMFRCVDASGGYEQDFHCADGDAVRFRYSVFCMFAMLIHWLLLMDLAVFSTGLSAFALVIGQVFSEMGRFLCALIFLLMTFSSAAAVLDHDYFEMRDIPRSVLALFAITVCLYEDDYRDILDDPALLFAVLAFLTMSGIMLMNLLIAQINASYLFVYNEMVGFARLKRADVICETLEIVSDKQWERFVEGLGFDQPLEFNRGDVGLAGGIQVMEPATHIAVVDRIVRYGGLCSLDMPYPEERSSSEHDKFDKVERQLRRVLKKLALGGHGASSSAGSSSMGGSFMDQSGSSASSWSGLA